MAFILKDRVKENSTTTGTGSISLGGASATFDTFQSYLTNGDTTYYAIAHTSSGVDEWEVGLGTWNTGNTLSRTTVLAGSNGTSAVNFSAGTKDIFMTYPASKAAVAGEDVTFADITVTGTVDGRNVAADGTKLDGIDTSADVTDAVTVAAAGALMKSGGTMTGSLILNADPNAALGAATKQYVDTIASAGIHYHAPVRAEHPSNLNATYNNGSSGVGATLTNAGTNAALVIDSVSMVLNDRVLVANQTDQTQNGVYTVTTVGDGSTAWVLTRSTDTDTAAPSDPDAFGKGDAFFIKEGSTNAGHLDVLSTSGTIVFGTTNIVFSEVAETTVYSGGTGITLTGTTFSIGQDVATSANVTFNQVTAAIIGNVTGNLTGDVTGNADTATALETARTIQVSGDVTGSASFDGTSNINITTTVQDDSHAHVISNVDGLQSALDAKVPMSRIITAGNGLTGGGDLSANRTLTVGGGTGITVNANDIAIDSSYTGFDSRYVNVTGDTITGDLQAAGLYVGSTNTSFDFYNNGTSYLNGATTIDANTQINGHLGIGGTATDSAWSDNLYGNTEVSIDGGGGYGVLHFRGDGAGTTNTRYSMGVGDSKFYMAYDDVDAVHRLQINSSHQLIVNEGSGEQRVFHDGYHPNADKWTTARTLSLSGDASGSVSWDGSANATLSVTVANDSHTHDTLYMRRDTPSLTSNINTIASKSEVVRWNNTTTGRPASGQSNEYGPLLQMAYNGDTVSQLSHDFDQDNLYFRKLNTSSDTGTTWKRIFHDNYHPNADKWTTARTLSLSGDASGSVSWDGSANATLSVTVANDSHSHSNYITSNADDTWSGNISTTSTNGIRFGNPNQSDSNDGYIAAGRFGSGLNIVGTQTSSGTGRQVRIWGEVITDGGNKYWNAGNDGSGSGLDADLLDGIHGGSFLRSDASDTVSAGVTYSWSATNTEGLRFTNTSYNKSLYIGGWSSSNTSGVSRIRNSNDNLHLDAGSAGNLYLNHYCTGNVYIRGSVAWHAGNDGSGSGLDADLLDGYHESSFIRKGVGYIWTATGGNALSFRSTDTIDSATGDLAALEVFQDTAGADAFMQFHIGGDYAKYFGLHGGINDFVVGGWSHGASYQRVFHDGYHPNADTLTTARTINGVSFNGSANITVADSTKLPLSGGTVTGTLTLSQDGQDVLNFSANDTNDNRGIAFNSRTALSADYNDGWLRINNASEFSNGIYTPANLRVDGTLTVASKIIHTSDSDTYLDFNTTNSWRVVTGNTEGLKVAGTTVDVPNQIRHTGDTDTYMQFSNTDEWRVVTSGTERLKVNYAGVRLGDTGNGYFQPVSGNYGSIQIGGGSHGGWEGYSIGGRAVFMHDSSSATGIYNDVNNEWLFYGVHNSYTRMYHNGSSKVETTSSGVSINGDLNSTSDVRYKKNIETIEGAIDKVTALRGVTFDWDNEAFPEDESSKKPNFTERATGVIAQDVEKVLPEAVRENAETGFKNVAYGNMVGLLIEAIKEQQTQIDILKAEIQSMKS